MATITSAGAGSGLDVSGLVDKLVAAEGEPVRLRLDRKEAELQAGLSAMGTFKGAVSEFQASLSSLRDSEAFESIEVSRQDEDIVAVSAGNDAQPGDYEVEVIQLAQAQKLSTDAFDSDLKPFGTGSMTIQLGSFDSDSNSFLTNPDVAPVSVSITAENNTLRGIQEAINKANAGVRASLINDGRGYRLVLSSLAAGNENSIRVSVVDNDGNNTDLNGLSNLAYDPVKSMGTGQNLGEAVAAQNAIVRIDGIEINRSTNNIDDVLPGTGLTLKPGSEGKTSLFTLGLNNEGINQAINTFIEKYNEMNNVISNLTGYDPETGVAGPLSGDASVRGVAAQIRRRLGTSFATINSVANSLASIGIDSQRNGNLSLNQSKLQNAIEDNRQELIHLFAASGSATDPLVNYLQAGSTANTDAYELVINELATQAEYSGERVAAGPLTIDETDNSFKLKVDGLSTGELQLAPGTYTSLSQVAGELQSAINSDGGLSLSGAAVSVSTDNGRLQIKSRRYGGNSTVELVSADTGLRGQLGLVAGTGKPGQDVQGTLNGVAAIGSGQILTGKGITEGLQVEVLGGQTGRRGKVIYSQGIAASLHDMIENVLDEDGILTVRSDGYGSRISDIGKEREQLARKLEVSEQRYLKQFTTLDATLGKMRSTGEFLSNQLSSLPGAAKAKS